MRENLLTKTIKCDSDRGGYVVFGNKNFQYSAKVSSPGDCAISVKIVDEKEWDKLRRSDERYDWSHTKELGFLEGHFYLYEDDCSHGNKEDSIVEFKGHFDLFDWCDSYDPTLYLIVRNSYNSKFKVLK